MFWFIALTILVFWASMFSELKVKQVCVISLQLSEGNLDVTQIITKFLPILIF